MCGRCSSNYTLWNSRLYRYNTIVPDLPRFLGIEAHVQTVDTRLSLSPPNENLGTRLNCTMHFISFNQNQPCSALVVESVHNHCCSPSVHLLRSMTWRVGLTLVSEGSGLLATLQPIHEHLHLRSCSNWGCIMSENKRWEVVQQTSSFCVRYIWSCGTSLLTHSIRHCVSASQVEEYSLCYSHWWF